MPYKIIKLPSSVAKYKVVNKITGKVFSYHTTKTNADKQLRLLHSLENKK